MKSSVLFILTMTYYRLLHYLWTMLRLQHVEQEILTLPEHLISLSVFMRVRIVHALVFGVCVSCLFPLLIFFLRVVLSLDCTSFECDFGMLLAFPYIADGNLNRFGPNDQEISDPKEN